MSNKKASTARANELTQKILGAPSLEDLLRSQIAPFDDFSPRQATRIIDGADGGVDIAAMVERWRQEDAKRTHAGGRPGRVSHRSVLILILMHAIARKPQTVKQLAATAAFALTPDKLELIGLTNDGASMSDWYQSIFAAKNSLLRLVDPFPFPRVPRKDPTRPAVVDRVNRHRILTSAKRQELQAYWDENAEWNELRYERHNDLTFEINANIIRSANEILQNFKGDLAMDATFTKVHGRHSSNDISLDARSVVIEAGLWMRGGTHGVDEATAKKRGNATFKFGLETDLVTMTLGPDEDAAELILAMNVHRPGRVTHVARTLFPRIDRLGLPKGTISVDRLYNDGLSPEDFHLPLLQHGYEFAFDYKDKQLGPKAHFSRNGVDYILVDGTWYLASMPDDLVYAALNSRLPVDHEDHIDRETLKRQIAARVPYQLRRWGSRDAEGFQRYHLPEPANLPPNIDFDTGEVIPNPTNKSVTIPGSIGVRWEQKHAFLGPEWRRAYNLRSAVERKNSQLKRGTTTDLDNADKRPQRTFAANSLAVGMLIAAHNLIQIQEHLIKMSGENHSKGPRKRSAKRPKELRLDNIQKQKDGRTRRKAA